MIEGDFEVEEGEEPHQEEVTEVIEVSIELYVMGYYKGRVLSLMPIGGFGDRGGRGGAPRGRGAPRGGSRGGRGGARGGKPGARGGAKTIIVRRCAVCNPSIERN